MTRTAPACLSATGLRHAERDGYDASLVALLVSLIWCGIGLPASAADDDPPTKEPPSAATAADESAADPPSVEAKRTRTRSAKKSARSAPKEPLAPPRQVQLTLLRQMKSKKPDTRLAAVRQLEQYPTAEAARLLVQHGLGSSLDDVRVAAYSTLIKLSDQRPVADYVLAAIEKSFKRGDSVDTAGSLLAVALASDDSLTESRALELFDQASRQPAGAPLVLGLADQLGVMADETSLGTLVKMSNRPVFNERFALRRAVVAAMCRVPLAAAVDALVKLLPTVTGEVRGDIVRHLTAVTGESHGLDDEAWTKWWKGNQEGFAYPLSGKHVPSMSQAVKKSSSTYYGLPLCAERIVFVIDTSASMSGGRIEAAKRELTSTILSLPRSVRFSVLAFDIAVTPWSKELLPATEENKAEAVAWVLVRGLGPATASYDALNAAFDFDTESIYFLTDGEPAGGAINDPLQIIALLTEMNRTRRLTINSIGIGVGLPGLANPFDTFLRVLAESNHGEYTRVDQ